MAAGDTLLLLDALASAPPASNYATFGTRNNQAVLNYDDTTQETAHFRAVMPQNYAGGNLIVVVHWAAASATSGTIGWIVCFERIGDSQQDIDSDGFAADQTIAATTVPGTSGHVDVTSVEVTAGAATDNIAAGETFRLAVKRDVASDNATGDAQLIAVEIREA